MPKDGPKRRKNLFRHPKQYPNGRGYRNGPFNDHTRDAAVQTEHVDQRNDVPEEPAPVSNGDEDRDGGADGVDENAPNQQQDGGGVRQREEDEGAPPENGPALQMMVTNLVETTLSLGELIDFLSTICENEMPIMQPNFPPQEMV